MASFIEKKQAANAFQTVKSSTDSLDSSLHTLSGCYSEARSECASPEDRATFKARLEGLMQPVQHACTEGDNAVTGLRSAGDPAAERALETAEVSDWGTLTQEAQETLDSVKTWLKDGE